MGVGERHIDGYEADPRCKVVSLCDINEAKLAEVAERYPGRYLTTNPVDILRDPDIDVISIASYDDAHFQQIMAAISAGKHVFVEKPLCLHDDEFDGIDRALADNPSIRLSSNLILRRVHRFRQLKDRIQAGSLGRLYYLEGNYNYGRVHKITEGWRGKIPFYSVTHGGSIHLIDLMLWLSGERVTEVTAIGNRIATAGSEFRHPDMVSALLRFEKGMIAKVAANFSCVCPHHHMLDVYGTAGTFMHGNQGDIYYHSRDPAATPECIKSSHSKPPKGDMLRAFVAHILDGTPPDVGISEVMDAMAVSLAIERSLRSGRWEAARYGRCSGDAKPAY